MLFTHNLLLVLVFITTLENKLGQRFAFLASIQHQRLMGGKVAGDQLLDPADLCDRPFPLLADLKDTGDGPAHLQSVDTYNTAITGLWLLQAITMASAI